MSTNQTKFRNKLLTASFGGSFPLAFSKRSARKSWLLTNGGLRLEAVLAMTNVEMDIAFCYLYRSVDSLLAQIIELRNERDNDLHVFDFTFGKLHDLARESTSVNSLVIQRNGMWQAVSQERLKLTKVR